MPHRGRKREGVRAGIKTIPYETVPTSGMFRQAFARRRCIVPADGFYEWKKLDAKTKQPTSTRRS
jgi:putative SOS response-associated peptidase YedK